MAQLALFCVAIALLITAWTGSHLHRRLAWRRAASQHGCRPPANTYNKEPCFGLDTLIPTLRALQQHRLLERGCELFCEYGFTFNFLELNRRAIVTIEPENIKAVLSLNFHDYGLAHRLEAFRPLLGEGIFDTDGHQWASSRALIRPSFTRDKLADLTTFESLFQNLLSLLHYDGSTSVDLQELFFRYTIDSATDFLYGQSVGTLKNVQSEQDFARAFDYAQRAVIIRSTMGVLSKVFRDPKADACNRICRRFAQQFVDQAFAANQAESKDDPQQRMPNFAQELASRSSDKGRILDELMNVLLAGRDTSASLLGNLFFVLAKRPAVWARLREEVRPLEGRPPTYDELRSGLKYVQCCLNESLRLHPVVPRNERQAIRDTILPTGGGQDGTSPVFVPKGTLVCYNLYAMHRRPDIYGADADKFRPERWEDGKLQPRWGYLPFNGGPRICIGQRYALTQAGYVLVRMVQNFAKLESCDAGPWEESLTLTLSSRNGTRVTLTADSSLQTQARE